MATQQGQHTPYRLFSDSEMENQEPPEWLIEDILPEGCLAEVYGESGIGKSFLAVSWAYSIATGVSWLGHACKRGLVVYIAAEGGSGFGPRIRAWKKGNQYDEDANVHYIREPINFLAPQSVERLLETLRQLAEKPVLLIVDTMARCFANGDENSTKDLSKFVAVIDRVRHDFGCAVLVIHHTGKDRTRRERGGTALRGAADTMIVMQKEKGSLEISCDKQRDAEPFGSIALRLESIDLDDGKSSCVIDECVFEVRKDGLTDDERLALKVLHEKFGQNGATSKEWQGEFRAASGKSETTYYRAARDLVKNGLIELPNNAPKKGARYTLTEKGRKAINVT